MPARFKFNHTFELDGADVTAQVWFTCSRIDGSVFDGANIVNVTFTDSTPSRSDDYFYPIVSRLAETYIYSVEGNRDAEDAMREAT